MGGNCIEAQHLENQKCLKVSIFDLQWSYDKVCDFLIKF